jgi:hypothetical protein
VIFTTFMAPPLLRLVFERSDAAGNLESSSESE